MWKADCPDRGKGVTSRRLKLFTVLSWALTVGLAAVLCLSVFQFIGIQFRAQQWELRLEGFRGQAYVWITDDQSQQQQVKIEFVHEPLISKAQRTLENCWEWDTSQIIQSSPHGMHGTGRFLTPWVRSFRWAGIWLHYNPNARIPEGLTDPPVPKLRKGGAFVPAWFLVGTCVLSVFTLMLTTARRRRCVTKGLCKVCGYDLRATPDRCPECGTVPTAVT
jgi:hypothetical protein